MERPAVPAGANLGVRAPGTRDRSVGHDRDVALEAPVHRRNSVEQLLGEVSDRSSRAAMSLATSARLE